MKYLSAQVLLGLCLSGVLADLPYHDFEGRDAHIEVLPPSTTSEIAQSQNGQHPPFHHPTGTGSQHHHHHHPPPTDSPNPSEHDIKYALRRHEPHHHPNDTAHPTLHPTGGHSHSSHHHHPTHAPPSSSETPPFPTKIVGRGAADYQDVDTTKTVTRTRGPSGGFPQGTGSPYPYPRPHPPHKKGVGEPCANTAECAPCAFGSPRRVPECGQNTSGEKVCLCVKGKPLMPGGH